MQQHKATEHERKGEAENVWGIELPERRYREGETERKGGRNRKKDREKERSRARNSKKDREKEQVTRETIVQKKSRNDSKRGGTA